MEYLNFKNLEAITRAEFEATKPYPFANLGGLLTEQGYQALLHNMPGMELFDQKFGKQRRAGQAPHDRYSLEYKPGMAVPKPWQEFIGELCSDRYRDKLANLLGAGKIEFRFHWHYTPSACSVSPHTDSTREHGSHLFYFNDEDDWDPNWGGQTLALDDGGKLDSNSAPDFDRFQGEIEFQSIGNFSAIMKRTDHAWHAVRAINCPEDKLRKVFIVVINPNSLFWKIRDRLIGKKKEAF